MLRGPAHTQKMDYPPRPFCREATGAIQVAAFAAARDDPVMREQWRAQGSRELS